MSFRWKTIIGLAAIQVVLLGLLIAASMSILRDATENAVRQRADTAAELFASLAKESILATDLATLESYAQDLLKQEGVRYVRVLNRRDRVLVQAGEETSLARPFSRDDDVHNVDDGIYDVAAQVMEGGAIFGRVQLGLDAQFASGAMVSAWRSISLIAGAELLLTVLFAFFLGRYLTRQLGSLVGASQALAEGDMAFRLPVADRDELGRAALAFNTMADRLEEQRRRLESSEERLKLALEGTNDGLWDWNVTTGEVYFSPRFETMLGYEPGDLTPHVDTWGKMVHPDDLEAVMAELKRHIAGEVDGYQTEHRVRNKSGEWIWILDRGKVVKRAADGAPLRAVGTHTNITARKALEHERKKLIQAIEQSPVSIMITDPEGRLEYVNPRFESLTGYTQQEVLGRNPRFLKSGHHKPAFYARMWRALQVEGEWRGEILNRKKNRERFWEAASISCLRDSTGRVTHYLGVKEDITDRKRVEEALRDSAEKLARAQQLAHVGNWEWNIPENRVSWSAEVSRMFGLDSSVTEEYSVYFSRVHVEDIPRVEKTMDAALAEGDGYDFEHRIVRPDGEIRIVQEIGEIRRNDQGEAVFVAGAVQDITDRKRAERLKNEFVSTVSHELRTPLTSIYGGLKMVLAGVTGELPGKAEKLVQLAYDNSERLNFLINDILDIQKIESGRMAFRFDSLDAASLVKRSVEENAGYAEKFDVRFHIREPLPEGLTVSGDESRLRQVLANLLSNAAKFSGAGTQVEVRVERVSSWVRFSVADHGPGISEEFRSRIFQKFAQADSSDTRMKGGTGLGLSITKALVESHHGEIGFESSPGKGATFHFRLPLSLSPGFNES